MSNEENLNIVKSAIRTYENFPKEGVVFRDIFGIFQDVTALRALKDLIVSHVSSLDVDVIVGLDSRGFLVGPIISLELGKPFLPIRKKGKLPGDVFQCSYALEYGEAMFEIQKNNLSSGKRVLIVDDLLATGGSMSGAIQLLKKSGATVIECLAVIELIALNGRAKLDAPVHSIVQY
ncbi:adenine phosphoribosyltransferase [Leptopilina heterotoma]|uniref:adenine phosphoribosyltransferase n=1 Tax=Leptopilina heterotoma TaxID=63436 RepID=UPI001CA84F1A|nr:adenine phosphoribosyltransferase [Leptopilina heterotoma]XP_043466361.1 adenine phosphoribosyltransferase [Leptopilina heterotoma]XP_043466362.1 adenine phosphoribosyltransferase [Leptopilina heterotoma]